MTDVARVFFVESQTQIQGNLSSLYEKVKCIKRTVSQSSMLRHRIKCQGRIYVHIKTAYRNIHHSYLISCPNVPCWLFNDMAIVFNYETEAFRVVTDDHFEFVLCQTAQSKFDFYPAYLRKTNRFSHCQALNHKNLPLYRWIYFIGRRKRQLNDRSFYNNMRF